MNLNIPEYGEFPEAVEATVVGEKIVFCKFVVDQSPPNPLKDEDGWGGLYHINNRSYTDSVSENGVVDLFKEHGFVIPVRFDDWGSGGSRWRLEHDDAFDFAGWRVMATLSEEADAVYDLVAAAIEEHGYNAVWVPDTSLAEGVEGMAPDAAYAEMRKYASQCCEYYEAWCNGDCWGWSVEIYDLARDEDGEPIEDHREYKGEPEIHEESCWGYIDFDKEHEYMASLMRESVEGFFAEPERLAAVA